MWLARIEKKGNAIRALRGRYGVALCELGRRGTVDLEWLESLPHLTRAQFTAEFLKLGLLTTEELDYTKQLQTWVRTYLTTEGQSLPSADRQAVLQYVQWQIAPGQRARPLSPLIARRRLVSTKTSIRSIVRFLLQLQAYSRSLATCTRADIERFGFHERVYAFLRWARRKKLTSARVPKRPEKPLPIGPGSVRREEHLERLFTDEKMPLWYRVAALLAYFGLQVGSILALRLEDVLSRGQDVKLRLRGREHLLDPRLGKLIIRLRNAERRTHKNAWLQGDSEWLFPGLYVGAARSPQTLYQALGRYDMPVASARNSFFLGRAQKLTWLAAAMDSLGLHPCGIAMWRAASNGKYAGYFAAFRRNAS
jgi:hypothetical protein